MTTPEPGTTRPWQRVLRRLMSDRLSRTRPAYAFCAAVACLEAARCGHDAVVVVEFGVAWGDGLRELARIGEELTRATGVDVAVVGFDRGGLPAPAGRRDHPEIWHEGQFSNGSLDALRTELGERATLHVGDLATTVPPFVEWLGPDRPLGAVLLDVDLYTSARDALRVFAGPDPAVYLPAVPTYVDDIDELLTFNTQCGEAAAIEEHNRAVPDRRLEPKLVRVGRPARRWHRKIHVCHVLDHPQRNGAPVPWPLEISVDRY